MSIRFAYFVFPLLLIFISSCEETKPAPHKGDEAKKEVKKASKECRMTSMSFIIGSTPRTLRFFYDQSVLSKIETYENGENINTTMAYSFNDKGGIQSFLSGRVIAKYVYDDNGRVRSINGERGLNTRTYEYNSKGQVIKQITEFGGKPQTVHEFEYDSKGQPFIVRVYNKNGVLTEVNEITFDDEKNPFKNKGAFVNSMEMMLGYPVGNFEHNVIAIKKTYKKKSSYTIGGKYKMPGDVDNNRIAYRYNNSGYPVEVSRIRSGQKSTMQITYECD